MNISMILHRIHDLFTRYSKQALLKHGAWMQSRCNACFNKQHQSQERSSSASPRISWAACSPVTARNQDIALSTKPVRPCQCLILCLLTSLPPQYEPPEAINIIRVTPPWRNCLMMHHACGVVRVGRVADLTCYLVSICPFSRGG